MSDDAHCDKCGKAGRRPRMHPAPDGWLYLEAKDDATGDVVIVHACSMACAAGLWQCGPGPRFDAEEVLALPDDADPGSDFSAPIRLNPEEWAAVVDLCENPPESTEALRRLMRGEQK